MAESTRSPAPRWGVVVGLCGVIMLSGASGAAADQPTGPPQEPEGGVTGQMREDSVTTFDPEAAVRQFDPEAAVRQFDPEDAVEHLGGSVDEEDVIVLETDILFAAMEWELPGSAGSKIGELAEEVPEGAAVQVHGHTDSNPVPDDYDFDNQVLSENRAEAVAEVLGEERPDLQLSVEGFGSDQPAVTEDEDDPETFAANRRVEIRYD